MTTQQQPQNYLDDFLGEFEDLDNEFSNFAVTKSNAPTSSSNADQKQSNNDWSIPIGEINEDIQSLSEEENNVEIQSNENNAEEPTKNLHNNADLDNQDDDVPVLKSVSNNTWSGLQFEHSKLTSVYEGLTASAVKDPAQTSYASAYKPKEQSKYISQQIQGGVADFPAIGEAPKEKIGQPKLPVVAQQKTQEQTKVPGYSSYSSALQSYQPKSNSDYAKVLQTVNNAQNKPVEPEKPVEKIEEKPAQSTGAYQPGSYRPKINIQKSQSAVKPMPVAISSTDGGYKPRRAAEGSSYASKFQK